MRRQSGRELEEQQPAARKCAKDLSILRRAAEMQRRQIAKKLNGNPRTALKAGVFLREWFGGKITVQPLPGGRLMAHWTQCSAALLTGPGTCGSGGSVWDFFSAPPSPDQAHVGPRPRSLEITA